MTLGVVRHAVLCLLSSMCTVVALWMQENCCKSGPIT